MKSCLKGRLIGQNVTLLCCPLLLRKPRKHKPHKKEGPMHAFPTVLLNYSEQCNHNTYHHPWTPPKSSAQDTRIRIAKQKPSKRDNRILIAKQQPSARYTTIHIAHCETSTSKTRQQHMEYVCVYVNVHAYVYVYVYASVFHSDANCPARRDNSRIHHLSEADALIVEPSPGNCDNATRTYIFRFDDWLSGPRTSFRRRFYNQTQ